MWIQLRRKRLLQAWNCITMFLTPFIWVLPRVARIEEPMNKMASLKEDRKTLLEKNNTSVMNVAKSSVRAQPLSSITESTVGRNLTHVMCAPRLSAGVPSWYSIEEHTLGKNLTSVMNVGKPLVRAQIFSDIGKDTQKKKSHQCCKGIKAFAQSFFNGKRHKAQTLLEYFSGVSGH